MQALVIYDSTFGQTAKVADAIASVLRQRYQVRVLHVSETDGHWPRDLGLLVVGGPNEKHGTSEALRATLETIPHRRLLGTPAAAFDTRYHRHLPLSGSAADVIARKLRAAGGMLLGKPESFYFFEPEGQLVDGELERARAWAHGLLEALPQAALLSV